MERTFTVDDSVLPPAQELASYKEIDPDIVRFLMDSASLEQRHRHEMDISKLKMVRKSESRTFGMNWWGMFFAFLSVLVLSGLAAFALYLDRPWFAGIFGFSALIAIVSIFVNKGDKATEKHKV